MKTKEQLLIIGAGPFAENVADIAEACDWEIAGFVINQDRERCSETIFDKRIYWIDEIAEFAGKCKVICAVGTTFRDDIVLQIRDRGFSYATLVHPSAIVSPKCQIEEGAIVSAGAIIATGTNIGKHVIVNRGTLIGHHVSIGDFSTIGPGVNLGGKCEIAEKAYVGMGAIVRNKCNIGRQSIVGAGAVVVKHVPAHVQVTGLPAKVTRENIEGA